MTDAVMIFGGGQVDCTGVGGNNPVAAMIAQMMMANDNQLFVSQVNDVQPQSVGNIARQAGLGI